MGLFPITFDFRLARLGPDGAAVLVVELEVLFDRTTFGVFAAFLLAVPAAVFVIGVLLVNGVGTDLDFPALGEPSYRSPVLAHRHACRWWWTHRRTTRRRHGGPGHGRRRHRRSTGTWGRHGHRAAGSRHSRPTRRMAHHHDVDVRLALAVFPCLAAHLPTGTCQGNFGRLAIGLHAFGKSGAVLAILDRATVSITLRVGIPERA